MQRLIPQERINRSTLRICAQTERGKDQLCTEWERYRSMPLHCSANSRRLFVVYIGTMRCGVATLLNWNDYWVLRKVLEFYYIEVRLLACLCQITAEEIIENEPHRTVCTNQP